MALYSSAGRYLQDSPRAWLRVANAVTQRLARQVIEGLPLDRLPTGTEPLRRSVSEALLASLLSPANAQLVARANSTRKRPGDLSTLSRKPSENLKSTWVNWMASAMTTRSLTSRQEVDSCGAGMETSLTKSAGCYLSGPSIDPSSEPTRHRCPRRTSVGVCTPVAPEISGPDAAGLLRGRRGRSRPVRWSPS